MTELFYLSEESIWILCILKQPPPTRLFFRCAVPSMVSMAASSLYQIVDGIFVGRFIGESALAAVNLVMPLISTVFAVSNMIATGAAVRISILLGGGERAEASRTFTFVLKVIAALSLLASIAGFLFAEPMVRLLARGAGSEAVQNGVTYMRLYAVFNPLMPLFFATDNFLRICGKERPSMWINVATQVLNIVLDTVLIGLLGKGVGAAALASCISMSLGAVVTLFLFRGKRLDLYYIRGRINLPQLLKLVLNGSSEFFSNIAMSVTDVVFNFYLLSYGGATAVAAFSVLMYVDSFVGMLIFGMCDSLQSPLSHCYGAGLLGKVNAIFRRILAAGAGLSIVSMLFMLFAGKYVAPFFIKAGDTELLAMSLSAMKLFAFSYLFGWVDMVFSSYFTALEKPSRSLLLSLLGTLVFPILSLAVMTSVLGLNGVWLSSSVSGFLVSIVAVVLYKTMPQRL